MEPKPNRTIVVIATSVIAVVLVIAGVLYATSRRNSTEQTPPAHSQTTNTADQATNTTNNEVVASGATIVFTDNGFSPQNYTVKKGQAVTVKNTSSSDVQFSSDDHPAHTDDPELNMSVLKPGESGTFTPPRAGTHGFHDHLQDQFTGTLVVTD